YDRLPDGFRRRRPPMDRPPAGRPARAPNPRRRSMPGFDHAALAAQIAADAGALVWDERPPALVAAAIRGREGELTAHGALAVTTGVYTGRSVKDKFIVADSLTRDRVWWENAAAISEVHFEALLADFLAAMRGRSLHGQHLAAGAD